jgi:hypothetical protein
MRLLKHEYVLIARTTGRTHAGWAKCGVSERAAVVNVGYTYTVTEIWVGVGRHWSSVLIGNKNIQIQRI